MVGDALIGFMEHRLARGVFPNALLSKEDFWRVPVWKRAQVFVFMTRYVLQMRGQGKWSKYPIAYYKMNARLFHNYCIHDKLIMESSPEYINLPAKSDSLDRTRGRGKHKHRGQSNKKRGRTVEPSDSLTESPVSAKRICINMEFTSEDDE